MIIKHREAIGGDGFFETQVEVIEKEEVIEIDEEEEAAKKAAAAEGSGKEDRIFGFTNFNDFKGKYFNGREVEPLQDLSRIRSIKQARSKYAKRYQPPPIQQTE